MTWMFEHLTGRINHFDAPWAFWLLIALPIGAGVAAIRRGGTITIPTTRGVAALAGRGWRVRLRWLPVAARLAALALLIVALARPQETSGQQKTSTEGVAVQIVIDRSGSMGEPLDDDGKQSDKISVTRRVVEQFVAGDGKGLKGRTSDMVGLIAFARYADTLAPLSRTHAALVESVRQLTPVKLRTEDGTAIGDALSLAAARLKRAEEEVSRARPGGAGSADTKPEFTIRSKAIVLLTDGENNAGDVWPEDAARLAKQWGIRIYAIAVGGQRFMNMPGLFGDQKMAVGGGADERLLQSLADITEGRFFKAQDADSLRNAYAAIDALEKTKIETSTFTNVTERFVPFVLAGLAMLGVQTFLSNAVFRRVP